MSTSDKTVASKYRGRQELLDGLQDLVLASSNLEKPDKGILEKVLDKFILKVSEIIVDSGDHVSDGYRATNLKQMVKIREDMKAQGLNASKDMDEPVTALLENLAGKKKVSELGPWAARRMLTRSLNGRKKSQSIHPSDDKCRCRRQQTDQSKDLGGHRTG